MTEKIKGLIEMPISQANLSIYDIEFVNENNDWFLRVYLDKEGGIGLNDIVEATQIISDLLDEHDPIEQEYILEVSSPGAERPLNSEDKLKGAIDQYVRIEMKDPKQGLDHVEGFLKSFDGEKLVVEYKVKTATKSIEIDYDNVKKARIAIKF